MNNEKKAPVLTLDHLAPYLPYGVELAFIVRDEVRYIDKITGISDISDYDLIKIKLGYNDSEHIWMFKPVLRPLSDLTKEIEHNGERFVPIVELFKMRTQSTGNEIFDYYIENDTAILRLKNQYLDNLAFRCLFEVDLEPGQVAFSIASETWDDFGAGKLIDERIDMCGNELMMFLKLFEWHFDVFGLIGENLAIIRKEEVDG